jgi:nitroreductase
VDALDAIRSRRSSGRLFEPAPSPEEIEVLLDAAQHAPDHGELRPWSFTVLAGKDKDDFGQVLADAYTARCELAGVEVVPAKHEKERTKLGRAPVVIVVGAVRRPSEQIPWIEQQLAAAAAAQNILLAATALGYGSMWRTGDPAYDDHVKQALGLAPQDAITGFLYIGTEGDRSHRDALRDAAR